MYIKKTPLCQAKPVNGIVAAYNQDYCETFISSGTISVDVRTMLPDGLIFYASDERHIDMITLYLNNGNVVFGFDLGSGPLYMRSPDTVNDGDWHTVSC